jgi:hypothetical protein
MEQFNMRKIILAVVMTLWAMSASAQVAVPNTFVAGERILASAMNANFDALESNVLNRTGGTITGNINVDNGVTVDGIDLSAVLGGTGTPTFGSLTVTGDVIVGVNKVTMAGATGNTMIAGTLDVTGDITGNLTGNVTGNVTGALTGNASTATNATTATTVTQASQPNITTAANLVSIGTITTGVWDAGEITSSSTVTERGRTVPMGEWIDIEYDADLFTTNSGTWTVQAGDVGYQKYMLIGKTMVVSFSYANTEIFVVGSQLRIPIPGGFVASEAGNATGVVFLVGANNGVAEMGRVTPANMAATADGLFIYRGAQSAHGTDAGGYFVQGTIIFEVQ